MNSTFNFNALILALKLALCEIKMYSKMQMKNIKF